MESLTDLLCLMDDVCRRFAPMWEPRQLPAGAHKRRRRSPLSLAELMTLVVLFHPLRFRQFKRVYLDQVRRYRPAAVAARPSYHRCVELLPRCAAPLAAWFETLQGSCAGISIVDATPLAVCDPRRLARHRVFNNSAGRGKTSMGWFQGFKRPLLINSPGELIQLKLTAGHGDDRKPLPQLCQGLFGYRFADKGYRGQRLTRALAEQGIQVITPLRKNLKPGPRTDFEKALLHRRCLIDTVFAELKPLCQIEHPRHRSVGNFLVNLMAGLGAYRLSDHKPTLKLMSINAVAAP